MKMTRKTFILTVAIVLISVLVVHAQKAEWKGKIEYENGIPVVKNPAEPLFGEITLEFEEDLSIGKNPDSGLDFYYGLGIAVDEEGDIFLLDPTENRIHVFDKEGRHRLSFGGKGQGPGELNRPDIHCFDFNSRGHLYVEDSRSGIKVFNQHGDCLDFMRTPYSIELFRPLIGGKVIAYRCQMDEKTNWDEIVLIDSSEKESRILFRFPQRKVIDSEDRVDGITVFAGRMILSEYGPEARMAPLSGERTLVGYGGLYRLLMVDSSGELLSVIEKEGSPLQYTKQEKKIVISEVVDAARELNLELHEKDILNRIDFPKYIPYFDNILADDRDFIFVKRHGAETKPLDCFVYDMFDGAGRYVFRVKMPFSPQIIRKGFAYYIEGRSENTRFVRSRIKNWDEITDKLEN